MKTRKLLERMTSYLNSDRRELESQLREMQQVLKQLKKKERRRTEKIAETSDPLTRERLEKEKDIIHAQRVKGLSVYRELKDRNKDPNQSPPEEDDV